MKSKWILKSQINLVKENKVKELMLPDFKTYYKAIVIKRVWYWHKNKHTHQWNRMNSPDLNQYIYVQLISWYNGAKSIHWRNNSFFNKWC